MAATYLFSSQELQQLIQRSRAMSGLSAEKSSEVMGKIADSSSPSAHQLYEILIAERDVYKLIERDYLQKTSLIMAEFQTEITHLKTEKLRNQQQETEHKAAQAETQTAEALIKSLNNPHS